MQNSGVSIQEIGEERLEEAAGMLARAFGGDPLMDFLFPLVGKLQYGYRFALMQYACQVRLMLDWPLFAVMEGELVRGVAMLSPPEDKSWPESLRSYYQGFKDFIGAEAAGRFERYGDLASRAKFDEPHYQLGVIGVDPCAQGRGLGRMLLEKTQLFSLRHPKSTGVLLDTENPRSRDFYQHHGYEIVGEMQMEEVTIWHMFRDDERRYIF